jgi:hypothetical protein
MPSLDHTKPQMGTDSSRFARKVNLQKGHFSQMSCFLNGSLMTTLCRSKLERERGAGLRSPGPHRSRTAFLYWLHCEFGVRITE